MFSSQKMEKTHPANYLEVIADYAPAAIAVFDKNMRYLHVSKVWLEIFDLTYDVIGKNHYEVFPSIAPEWKKYHQEGLEGRTIHKQQDFHLLFNGQKVWINWEIRPWYNDQHEVAGIIILVKDITERIESEAARIEGEKKFRAMFDHAAIGMIQVDPAGKFLLVNPQFCQMTGYSEKELLRKSFMEITFPEDLERSIHKLHKLLSNEISHFEEEKRYVKKDGSIIWVYLTSTIIRDENGKAKYFVTTAQDISRRKSMEQALLENEQKFKAIFDQTAMGMAQVSMDGKILTANEKCCDILGYSLEELQGLSFPKFTHPEDVAKDVDSFKDLIDGKIATYSLEKRYIRKNRHVIWAFLTVSIVRDGDNNPLYIISALHDVTHRKAAEEELKESKQDLKRRVEERTSYLSLLQTISSEANKSDDVWVALKISLHEICKLTKWQIGHFYMVDDSHRGKIPKSDLWCLEDAEKYEPFVNKTEKIQAHDMSIIRRVIITGKPFWSNDIFNDRTLVRSDVGRQVGIKSGMAFPVMVGEEVAGVLEFFSNINIHPSPNLMELMAQIGIQLGRLLERQRSTHEIELSQARLQAIIDNLPARIYLKDRERRYLLVNKVFKEFFNIQDHELKGNTITDLFPERLSKLWAKDDDLVINEGRVVSYDIKYGKNEFGTQRIFHLTKFPVFDSNGHIYAYGGISMEITELKAAEEKMRSLLESEHKARTEAEKAIGMRDEFISIASHELKSPITALKMKAQLLLRHMNKDPTLDEKKELKSSLCKLDQDADRLVTLINRLLDITRIQTGHFELQKEMLNVNDVIQNLIDSLSPQPVNENKKLEVEMKTQIKAYWDKSRIEQVLINLLTNAFKFGEGKPIKLTLEGNDAWARISVQDHGRGIPKEFQSKIFDRYERANVKEGIQGLGLGLYIVKQILETHGGRIYVESEEGKGSTFVVELPLDHIPLPVAIPKELPPESMHHH